MPSRRTTLDFCWNERDGTSHRAPLAVIAGFADVDAEVMLFCHTHIARAVSFPNSCLAINPGSVGCFGFADTDATKPYVITAGTPHAAYTILDNGRLGWTVSHRHLPYYYSDCITWADFCIGDPQLKSARCHKANPLFGVRVVQAKRFGVQHQAWISGAVVGVYRVAQNRVAKTQHVHPQLVAATGHWQ